MTLTSPFNHQHCSRRREYWTFFSRRLSFPWIIFSELIARFTASLWTSGWCCPFKGPLSIKNLWHAPYKPHWSLGARIMHATRLSWPKASVHHGTGLSRPAVTAILISHYGVTVLGPFKHVACDVLPVTALCLGNFFKWTLAPPHTWSTMWKQLHLVGRPGAATMTNSPLVKWICFSTENPVWEISLQLLWNVTQYDSFWLEVFFFLMLLW